MSRLDEIFRKHGLTSTESSSEELLKYRVESYNRKQGELTGYDCPLCLNKGHVMEINKGYETYIPCTCMEIRRNVKLIERSGLKDMVSDNTFANYQVTDVWQEHVLQNAKEYAENPQGWFFIGGQVGAGKTHICTAIVGSLLNKGIATKYCLWREESTRLKSIVNDTEYEGEISKLKKIPCLYIDDFLKTKRGAEVKPADVNIAFEILNYRYNNKLLTVISSEKTSGEILNIDEATGSRIVQMSKDYLLDISRDIEKNYRLR